MTKLRPLLVPALLVLAVLVVVWSMNRASRLSGDLDRARQDAALRAGGLAVERDAARGDLARAAKEAVELREQLVAARNVDPGVRVVEVVKWRTKPGTASGPPRDVAPAEGGAVTPPAQPTPGVPAGGGCLLMPGDVGEVRVVEAQLLGSAGSKVVVGSAEAWRLEPGPPARLFGGPLAAQVTQAIVESERSLPRWGAGLAVYGGPHGWAAGPVVSPPPLRFWGLEGEVLAGAGAGPSGAWQASATALVRW